MAADLPGQLAAWAAEAPLPPFDGSLHDLGVLWQAWLAGPQAGLRTRQGSWYTPPEVCAVLASAVLASAVLASTALAAERAEAAFVLDPACGDGRFLLAALDAQLAGGVEPQRALSRLCGIDRDPGAVWLARAALWQRWREYGVPEARQLCGQIRWGDALPAPADSEHPSLVVSDWLCSLGANTGADVVVGNPPYLSQLRDRTVRDRAAAAALAAATDGEVQGYADTAAAFWALGSRWLAPGGALCLLLPRSVLSSRDAAPVRRGLAKRLSLQCAWRDDRLLFDASVRTAALVLADRPAPDQVEVLTGTPPRREALLPSQQVSDAEQWSVLLLDAADHLVQVPRSLQSESTATIGSLAQVSADFRDEYYGLAPGLVEGPPDAALRVVTSGLVDPLGLAWGERPCKLLGQRWNRPQLLPERLEPAMQRWWHKKAQPKVLVATQTAVLEAAVDLAGVVVPVTPLLSVLPQDPRDVWRLASALTAPILSRLALERHAGAGLSAGALKLSARQLAALPLPTDSTVWDQAAALAAGLAPDRPAVVQVPFAELLVCLGRAYGQPEEDARAAARWWWRKLGRACPDPQFG